MPTELSRAEQSVRLKYQKALGASLRMVRKGSDWRSADGCLFREHSGWFVSVEPLAYVLYERTEIIARAKPLAIDPIFWDLFRMPENSELPLSFRLRGAFVCHAPELRKERLSEEGGVDAVAKRALEFAESQLPFLSTWSAQGFLELCESDPGPWKLSCIVSTLVLLGREQEALQVCEDAIARGETGQFLSAEGSFVELAATWIGESLANRTAH